MCGYADVRMKAQRIIRRPPDFSGGFLFEAYHGDPVIGSYLNYINKFKR
jgi:hypothetical protein